MAQLVVRGLEDDLVVLLKQRAAARGRSAEAEHRVILREALVDSDPRRTFKALLLSMPDVGVDDDYRPVRDLPRPDAE